MINYIISKCPKFAQKIYDETQVSGKGNPLGIVQEV